jgi:hypothetical protein
MSSLPSQSFFSEPRPSPSRCRTLFSLSRSVPTSAPTSTPFARDYLPFHFGFEAEVILRPRHIADLEEGLRIPSFDAPTKETRQFNCLLLRIVANLLSGAGMLAEVFDQGDDGNPDYSKWTVTSDASLSKKHIKDGFCKRTSY